MRRAVAACYNAAFSEIPELTLPAERPGTRIVYHLYPVRCRDAAARDGLREHLRTRGVETGIHYPIANHLQPAMASRGVPPFLPRAEAVARTTVSLPMFPGLTDADLATVIQAMQDFF